MKTYTNKNITFTANLELCINLKLIIRISHTEPGNVKGFYKKLNEDLNKEIKVVADELAKATKA